MHTPLVTVVIESIYKNKSGATVMLPDYMAKATPDMAGSIYALASEVASLGGKLVLSDLFRSHDMQLQAHLDYINGKKKAYSPPPGGSFHEAGRAMDIELGKTGMPLANFWLLAKKYNIVPIISSPDIHKNEAWHFECRGSHQTVINYYQNKFGNNFPDPYMAGAASAILAANIPVDFFGSQQKEAQLQALLIRLGENIGNIDGVIGGKTQAALAGLKLNGASLSDTLNAVENLAQQTFPEEYSTLYPAQSQPLFFDSKIPQHLSWQ